MIEYRVLRQVGRFCLTRSTYPSQKAFKQGLVLQVIVGKQNWAGGQQIRVSANQWVSRIRHALAAGFFHLSGFLDFVCSRDRLAASGYH